MLVFEFGRNVVSALEIKILFALVNHYNPDPGGQVTFCGDHKATVFGLITLVGLSALDI